MKEFVTYPSRKREKSQDISKMKDDVKESQESSMVQKSANRSSWEMPRISNCPKLSRIIFIYVKFFINVFSLNCFYEAKNVSSLFISRKLISSLKKLNSNKFEFYSQNSTELAQLELIL